MPVKMYAAVVEQFGKPLELVEWEIPSPGTNQILVKTEACGVCHTDLHAAHGDWPVKPTLPFIPGHEAIGLVAAVGSGVTDVKEGDRVGVPRLYSACGHCEFCLTGWETVCAKAHCGGGCRAVDLRWNHDLQGDQGDCGEAGRMDRYLWSWRTRSPGRAICKGHGAARLR